MHLDLMDTVTIDVLLERLQNSAIRDGDITAAASLGLTREHLPVDGGAPDEMLVMHIQALLTPLLESKNPAKLPDVIKARIREIFVSLDRGRIRQ